MVSLVFYMLRGYVRWLTDRFLGLPLERLDLGLELVDGVAVLVLRSLAFFQLHTNTDDKRPQRFNPIVQRSL